MYFDLRERAQDRLVVAPALGCPAVLTVLLRLTAGRCTLAGLTGVAAAAADTPPAPSLRAAARRVCRLNLAGGYTLGGAVYYRARRWPPYVRAAVRAFAEGRDSRVGTHPGAAG